MKKNFEKNFQKKFPKKIEKNIEKIFEKNFRKKKISKKFSQPSQVPYSLFHEFLCLFYYDVINVTISDPYTTDKPSKSAILSTTALPLISIFLWVFITPF